MLKYSFSQSAKDHKKERRSSPVAFYLQSIRGIPLNANDICRTSETERKSDRL